MKYFIYESNEHRFDSTVYPEIVVCISENELIEILRNDYWSKSQWDIPLYICKNSQINNRHKHHWIGEYISINDIIGDDKIEWKF